MEPLKAIHAGQTARQQGHRFPLGSVFRVGKQSCEYRSISSCAKPFGSGPATSRECVQPHPATQFVVSCVTTSASSASQSGDTNSSAIRFEFKISTVSIGADRIRGGTIHSSAVADVGTVKRPLPCSIQLHGDSTREMLKGAQTIQASRCYVSRKSGHRSE